MQVKVDDSSKASLIVLAQINRRSPTSEANVAITSHINDNWPLIADKVGKVVESKLEKTRGITRRKQ